MSRFQHRTIQAIMGLVIIAFAFLSWMAVSPLRTEMKETADWAIANPSPNAGSTEAASSAKAASSPSVGPSAAPAKGEWITYAALPVPEGCTQELEVKVKMMPATLEEFRALRDSVACTPEGGAALFVLAMNAYVRDRAFGEACLTMMLANDPLLVEKAEPGSWKGFRPSEGSAFLLEHMLRYEGIARSYVYGTKIDDDYSLPSPPWTIRISRNKYSAYENGDIKVFIFSMGAPSRRPIDMRKNDQGIWKVSDFESLPLPVRKPIPHDSL
jgi:hypothetical protein